MCFAAKNPLWAALEDKGFVIRREFGKFEPEWLKETDQLWILATAPEATLKKQRLAIPDVNTLRREMTDDLKKPGKREAFIKKWGAKFPKGKIEDCIDFQSSTIALTLSPTFHLAPGDYAAIAAFAKAGGGLCLLADNDPFTFEANELARRLFDVRIQGNYQGEKIAYVKNGQLTPAQVEKYKGDYEVDPHALLTGVNFVYEGITISNVSPSDELEVALRASNGKAVIAVSKVPGVRVIIDCGFTRYVHGPNDDVSFITKTAGTTRLAENMAAYLAGKDKKKKP